MPQIVWEPPLDRIIEQNHKKDQQNKGNRYQEGENKAKRQIFMKEKERKKQKQ